MPIFFDMSNFKRLFTLAFIFSGSTLVFGVACLVGFILRWLDAPFFTLLSHNAGYVGYGALASCSACFLTLLAASKLSHVLQAEREAAALAVTAKSVGVDPA